MEFTFTSSTRVVVIWAKWPYRIKIQLTMLSNIARRAAVWNGLTVAFLLHTLIYINTPPTTHTPYPIYTPYVFPSQWHVLRPLLWNSTNTASFCFSFSFVVCSLGRLLLLQLPSLRRHHRPVLQCLCPSMMKMFLLIMMRNSPLLPSFRSVCVPTCELS